MYKKRIIVLLLLALIFVVLRFWVGLYQHDEFGDKHLFLKHRPIWKWEFYSPIGMSDLKIEKLSFEKQHEQLLFNEFVRDQGLSR